jgi:hypothetical protein
VDAFTDGVLFTVGTLFSEGKAALFVVKTRLDGFIPKPSLDRRMNKFLNHLFKRPKIG